MAKTILILLLALNTACILAKDPNTPLALPAIPDQVDFEYDLSYDIIPKPLKKLQHLLCRLELSPEVTLTVNLPQSIPGRQKITKMEIAPSPSRRFTENGQQYAEFTMPVPETTSTIKIHISITVYKYDLTTVTKAKNPVLLSQDQLQPYLVHERMIEVNDPIVQNIAHTIEGNSELEIIKNIFSYTVQNIAGDGSKHKGVGAAKTLQSGEGMCIDYADVFVALCRAKQIPARVTAGYRIPPPEYAHQRNFSKHAWVEVYFKEYGWIPFEVTQLPTLTDNQLDYLLKHNWGYYLKLTDIRNDPVLNNNYYFHYPRNDKRIRKYLHYILETIEFTKPFQQEFNSKDDWEQTEYEKKMKTEKKAVLQKKEQL